MSRNQPGVSPETSPRPGPNQRRTNPPRPLPGGAESEEKVGPFQSDTAKHAIYAADAILDYPQSGERFRGRSQIQAQRGGHPDERHFTILRIRGGGDLWVSECVITYDSVPTYPVSPTQFTGDLVTHETQ